MEFIELSLMLFFFPSCGRIYNKLFAYGGFNSDLDSIQDMEGKRKSRLMFFT